MVARAEVPADLARIEDAYARMNDALGAVGLIDSGYTASHQGRDREAWSRELESQRTAVQAGLAKLEGDVLSPADRRAVEIMSDAVQTERCLGGTRPRGALQGCLAGRPRLHGAERGPLRLLRRAREQHRIRRCATHTRRGLRSAVAHRRARASKGALRRLRPAVAGDQRRRPTGEPLSPPDQHGLRRGSPARLGHR